MKGVVPGPTGDTSVIVVTDPVESLEVAATDASLQLQKFAGVYFELLLVVFLLVAIESMTENGVVL